MRGTTSDSDPRTLNRETLVDLIEYGESVAEASSLNLRTRVYRHFDSAGLVVNAGVAGNGTAEAYDFKGNLLRSTRRLARDYKAIPDWALPAEAQLEAETFEGTTRYDALNRPVQSIAPRSSLTRPGHPNKINVIQPVFNEANLLERVDVWLERADEPGALLDPGSVLPSPVGVANIDYDAKGQRRRIDYKNGASTLYSHDPLTFRLTRLLTRRNAAAFPGDDPQPPMAGWPGRQVQNLHYTHDPAGNITHIQGRRPAGDLLPQPARRAEQRLHLRRHLPAGSGDGSRTSGARWRADPPFPQRCRAHGHLERQPGRTVRAERRGRDGHLHGALRL